RTLYLPSAGLVLAANAALSRLPPERMRLVVAMLCLLGGVRTALRVPTWRDDNAVTQSILEDSPDSYGGPVRMAGVYLDRHEPAKALAAARIAAGLAKAPMYSPVADVGGARSDGVTGSSEMS